MPQTIERTIHESHRGEPHFDWEGDGYSRAVGNQACSDALAEATGSDQPQCANAVQRDGFPAAGTINIGPYSVLVFSQDKPV